jgi:hypothetical protein
MGKLLILVFTSILMLIFNVYAKEFECNNGLYPVYAKENGNEIYSVGYHGKDEFYFNKYNVPYVFRGSMKESLIVIVTGDNTISKKYVVLSIYNNLSVEKVGWKESNLRHNIYKGEIIGCISDPKKLEYFKIKCYDNCWEEWQ